MTRGGSAALLVLSYVGALNMHCRRRNVLSAVQMAMRMTVNEYGGAEDDIA